MNEEFEYYAFISYNRNDVREAAALRRFLEDFRIPKKLAEEHHKGNRFGKIFFAPENLSYAEDLTDELKERLRQSRFLIVVCSPDSANSDWVGKEVDYFCSLNRKERILLYIVGGVPVMDHPDNCYHKAIWNNGLGSKLAADITTCNSDAVWFKRVVQCVADDKLAAKLNIVAGLLGVKDRTEFVSSQKRRSKLNNMFFFVVLLMVLFVVFAGWLPNRSVDMSLQLRDLHMNNVDLPSFRNGTVTLFVDNDSITKKVEVENKSVVFPNIPRKFLGNSARVVFSGNGFCPLDVKVKLQKNMVLPIDRDSLLYGRVFFKLRDFNQHAVVGCAVCIEGIKAVSDQNGTVELYVPLSRQKRMYVIECEKELRNNSIIVPCTGSEVVFVK